MDNSISALTKLQHPVRAAIMDRLAHPRDTDETVTHQGEIMAITSPKQIADDLDIPLGTVSYHFRRLTDIGFLKLLRKVPRRGAIQHYYGPGHLLDGRALRILDHQWFALPESLRQTFARAAVRELIERTKADPHHDENHNTLAGGWAEVLDECAAMCETVGVFRHHKHESTKTR